MLESRADPQKAEELELKHRYLNEAEQGKRRDEPQFGLVEHQQHQIQHVRTLQGHHRQQGKGQGLKSRHNRSATHPHPHPANLEPVRLLKHKLRYRNIVMVGTEFSHLQEVLHREGKNCKLHQEVPHEESLLHL